MLDGQDSNPGPTPGRAALLVFEAQAQHFHLNVGAQSQTQSSPLFCQNGAAFETNSGFVLPLPFAATGAYAGFYATASLTPTAIGTGFFDPPAPGTLVRLRFVSVAGPSADSFGVWDVPGFNDAEEPATALTFSVPVGTTNGTQSILLSQNLAAPSADPFGHIQAKTKQPSARIFQFIMKNLILLIGSGGWSQN